MLLFFTQPDRLRKVKFPFDKIPPCHKPCLGREVLINVCLFLTTNKQQGIVWTHLVAAVADLMTTRTLY